MNPNNVPAKFDSQVSVKMPSELLDVLKEIEEKHGINPADALRRCAESIAAFYEDRGYFALPVRIVPDAEFIAAVKETPNPNYRPGPAAPEAKPKRKAG